MTTAADVRTHIATLLTSIPSILHVDTYLRADVGNNVLPAAAIWLQRIRTPGYEQGEVPRFGPSDFECEWVIDVRLPGRSGEQAQQTFESVHAAIRDQIASTGILFTDSSSTTYLSTITLGEFAIPRDESDVFHASFTLITLTLT